MAEEEVNSGNLELDARIKEWLAWDKVSFDNLL